MSIGVIQLPPPIRKGIVSLEEALAGRKSIRGFRQEALNLSDLGQVLWAAQGITSGSRRTIPSAGATYPLEVFLACDEGGVEVLEAGVYRYQPASHTLSQHYPEDILAELTQAALNQDFIAEAPVTIIIRAVYERTSGRYGNRTQRYIDIEVGHAGQNIYLQATALGLGTVAVGAFQDEKLAQVLQLDKQHKPIYIMPLGKPR